MKKSLNTREYEVFNFCDFGCVVICNGTINVLKPKLRLRLHGPDSWNSLDFTNGERAYIHRARRSPKGSTPDNSSLGVDEGKCSICGLVFD